MSDATMSMARRDADGPVALVTGAARGIGRGIVLVLGEVGATVYVTDRESRARKTSEPLGTVEFPGPMVRALLEDPGVERHAGRTIPVADAAEEYGFTDLESGAESG